MPFGFDSAGSIRRQARTLADAVVDDAMAVASVPAPTGAEQRRALLLRDLLRRDDPGRLVYIDPAGNVVARIPGRRRDRSVLIAAHLDTVFGLDVPHQPKRDAGRLLGPGIGDNALAIAAMIALPALLSQSRVEPACDIVLVGTVGEEGYGNLRGITAALDLNREVAAVVAVEGHGLGRVTHVAVGSRRFAIRIDGPGGHSWADYGRPSAVHAAGELTARLVRLPRPEWPRTTLNVASLHGGSGINAIATTATLEVEIRSTDSRALDRIHADVLAELQATERDGLTLRLDTLGVRPGGALAAEHLIVRRARAALAAVSVTSASDASSTDANVPIALGIPAVCIGISRGGDAHSLNEWIETEPIAAGLAQLGILTQTVAGDVARGDLVRPGWSAGRGDAMAAASD